MFIYVTRGFDNNPLILSTTQIIMVEKSPFAAGSLISLGGDKIHVLESVQDIWSMLRPEHAVPKKEDDTKENKPKGIFNREYSLAAMQCIVRTEFAHAHEDDIISKMQDEYPEGCKEDFIAALDYLENARVVYNFQGWYSLLEED